jgi:hypothetical protein
MGMIDPATSFDFDRRFAVDPTACTTYPNFYAWPGRRIAELTRRFDEAMMCSGRPCRNGLIFSSCGRDIGDRLPEIARRIQRRL